MNSESEQKASQLQINMLYELGTRRRDKYEFIRECILAYGKRPENFTSVEAIRTIALLREKDRVK